ncbi:hypothetical protein CLU79DRAFT_754222 [Phycomyces nitens]|nr:hypothetical protein CLU79DRAFT_754222 [Phycomyces nitens]
MHIDFCIGFAHSLILDTSEKVRNKCFTEEELFEIESYNNKHFRDLPVPLQAYFDSLKESDDAASLSRIS